MAFPAQLARKAFFSQLSGFLRRTAQAIHKKEEAYKKELILAVRFMPIMPKQISGRTMSP